MFMYFRKYCPLADLSENIFGMKKELGENKDNLDVTMGKINSQEEEGRQNIALRKLKEVPPTKSDNEDLNDNEKEKDYKKLLNGQIKSCKNLRLEEENLFKDWQSWKLNKLRTWVTLKPNIIRLMKN